MQTRLKTYTHNNKHDDECDKHDDCNKTPPPPQNQNLFTQLFDFVVNAARYIYVGTIFYVMWIMLHFVASHVYINVCVPQTLWGFIISPFMSLTPQCQSLRWIIYNGGNVINNMWIVLGTWCCSILMSSHAS
jgi:hypothetical protein